MRSRKQLGIPPSLLRDFGRDRKGQGLQVTVCSRSLGMFRISMKDLGGDPEPATDPLQDALARGIRTMEPGQVVRPEHAAELVARLCERQARLRQSSSDAMDQMFSGLENALLDREKVRQLFGPETDAGIADIRPLLAAPPTIDIYEVRRSLSRQVGA